MIGEVDGFSGSPLNEAEIRGLRPCFLRRQCHEPALMPVVGMVSRSTELRAEENRQVRESVGSCQGHSRTHDRTAVSAAVSISRHANAETLIVKVPQVADDLPHGNSPRRTDRFQWIAARFGPPSLV